MTNVIPLSTIATSEGLALRVELAASCLAAILRGRGQVENYTLVADTLSNLAREAGAFLRVRDPEQAPEMAVVE